MTPSRWQHIDAIYHSALERVPAERSAYLDEACANDPELRKEVESLLVRDASRMSTLDRAAREGRVDLPSGESTMTVLTPGMQLGPYKIEGHLGKGGMGEVFRAIDTRLGRPVAIKTSQEHFSERFEREARAISSLNHPHICTLYDVGATPSGTSYLVMELIEGESLATRLKRGKLSTADTLKYAQQIAEALATAHAKGIIHRDLKPHNIMLATNGVKVLDFGLAKSAQDATLTASHAVMGTPAYMAPEQHEGKEADPRTDIYALGLVLYEMATGHRSTQGTIRGQDELPFQLAHIIERCLTQDPGDRWQTAQDVRAELAWAANSKPLAETASPPRSRWGIAGIALGIGLVTAAAVWIQKRSAPEPDVLQMEIAPPDGARFRAAVSPFALSPDGRRIAFVGIDQNGKQLLWIRALNTGVSTPLTGTENAELPFWSPDNRWVGFYSNGKLRKFDTVAGGAPSVICETEGTAGATWNSDGVIVFDQGTKPLQRVSATGGTPTQIFAFDKARQEIRQGAPFFLPDGKHFVYYSTGKTWDVMVASLDGKLNRLLLKNVAVPSYTPNPRGGGAILYNNGGQLFARPFDPDKLEFTGEPQVLADNVGYARWWSASNNGVLSYRHNLSLQYQLAWFSRDGRMLGTLGEPGLLANPRISPDQRTISFDRTEDQHISIWTIDLARNSSVRLVSTSGDTLNAAWSPDSTSLVYSASRDGGQYMMERSLVGTKQEKRLLSQTGNPVLPSAVSRDGRWLAFIDESPTHSSLMLLSLSNPAQQIRMEEKEMGRDGAFSPDGRWFLYSSIPDSRREVFVQSLPSGSGDFSRAGGKWQISTDGGSQPVWRADGKEIYYLAPDGMMMAVSVESSEDLFRADVPKALFRTRLASEVRTNATTSRQYDVSSDGQRFLVNQLAPDSVEPPMEVLFNWPKRMQIQNK